MHRFHLPPAQCHPLALLLEGGEARHARDVLRLRPGDEAVVLDGAGREFLCKVRTTDRHGVALDAVETRTEAPPPSKITLVQAIPKGKIFESIIQKATELGVSRIVPLVSERVAARFDAESARDKAEKWRQTAIEAIKQCGQKWLPEVLEPAGLPEILARIGTFDLALVGSLQGDGRHPREYFRELELQNQTRPKTVCAWIGPEGDFTGEELDAIRGAGARPITLGPLVLRSETAAIFTLSIINYELQSLPVNGPA